MLKRLKKAIKYLSLPINGETFIYLLSKDEYQKLLTENVTKTYKMTNMRQVYDINNKTKSIAKQLSIDDRIERIHENESYITIKDHKEEFPNKTSCRLINQSKSDVGKISKTILDKIVTKIDSLINVNRWKNSISVIEVYKTILNKDKYRFVIFDIESFYPSISLELFNEALNFAKTLGISETEVSKMMPPRKTLLFNDSKPWLKKFGNEDFDVPIGCFDGAEVCELVGSFILTKLSDVLDIQFNLLKGIFKPY